MQTYLVPPSSKKSAVKLTIVRAKKFNTWKKQQCQPLQTWFSENGMKGVAGQVGLVPGPDSHKLVKVVAVIADEPDMWSLAHLSATLPKGLYKPEAAGADFSGEQWELMVLGWQLATYRFSGYKQKAKAAEFASLMLPKKVDAKAIADQAEATFLVRDLINRAPNDLTPLALADAAKSLAERHKAKCRVIKGDALLKANYPLIHAVGRGSSNSPCLADFSWGRAKAPKVTLVGKGVSFDSGGLDMKSPAGMKLMKKDMGGAAQVLGLAHLIMASGLDVRLRVLIPAAENSVSADAYRPSDVIKSRNGLSVEIGNTDAEGRLIVSDALAEADSEKPDLLIDCTTLTGAARIALGTEVPAFFTPDDALADDLAKLSSKVCDPLWRLPLWQSYRDLLNSDIADINNAAETGYGGAITAALFLKEFVKQAKSWVHLDLMAWNTRSQPGRPAGGEAMGMRTLFGVLKKRYGV